MKSNGFLRRILVPTDGSSSSTIAEETAATIAKKTGASVVVFHVMPDILVTQPIPDRVRDDLRGSVRQRSEVILGEARSLFAEERVDVDTETVMSRDVAASILDYSKDNCDLIVMGAHGENKKVDYMLGSITKKVLTQAPCPVFIAKKMSRMLRLLVCVDGSEHSTKALKFAVDLAEAMGSSVTLLNVQEKRLQKASAEVAKQVSNRVLEDSLNTVKNRNVKIDKAFEVGVASEAIVSVADGGKHDVIFLGSRGLGTVKRFVVGSVSDDVSQSAKISVLIVP
jgi:nucleotide-binding universal stress UspA family protein